MTMVWRKQRPGGIVYAPDGMTPQTFGDLVMAMSDVPVGLPGQMYGLCADGKYGWGYPPDTVNISRAGMAAANSCKQKEPAMTDEQFQCSAADLYAIRRLRRAEQSGVLETLMGLKKDDVVKLTADGEGGLTMTGIDRVPFDWATVKPGMAFMLDGQEYDEIVYYVGPTLEGTQNVITKSSRFGLRHTLKCALTYCPWMDIKL